MYLAAIVHDYGHKEVNNDFLIKMQDRLALLYNDRSPMENHHVAATWIMLKQEEFNFLRKMPRKVSRRGHPTGLLPAAECRFPSQYTVMLLTPPIPPPLPAASPGLRRPPKAGRRNGFGHGHEAGARIRPPSIHLPGLAIILS